MPPPQIRFTNKEYLFLALLLGPAAFVLLLTAAPVLLVAKAYEKARGR